MRIKQFYNIITIAIVLICAINCANRTVGDVILKTFGIDIHNLDYSVVQQNERWMPNGDGFYFAKLSFQIESVDLLLAQLQQKGGKELPIDAQYTSLHKLINSYKEDGCCGLYIILIDTQDNRNYSALIFDEKTQELTVQIEVY